MKIVLFKILLFSEARQLNLILFVIDITGLGNPDES